MSAGPPYPHAELEVLRVHDLVEDAEQLREGREARVEARARGKKGMQTRPVASLRTHLPLHHQLRRRQMLSAEQRCQHGA